MTPAARLAAAIEILDDLARGDAPADAVAAHWFRGHRFAGSGDRRAIRELVYRDLRRGEMYRWALGEAGGDPESPRARAIAATVLDEGDDPAHLFDGSGYGPASLDAEEAGFAIRLAALDPGDAPVRARANVPGTLFARLAGQWGDGAVDEALALNERAPVDVRVNTLRATPSEARAALEREGFVTEPMPFAPAGLRGEARANLDALAPFRDGLVEPQDESSQLVAALAAARPGETVVDYCAGAGGKALALAAAMENRGAIVACDVSDARLARVAPRARRLGVGIIRTRAIAAGAVPGDLAGKADRVLVDAPCTGSGTWRRRPELRWRTDAAAIADFARIQGEILAAAAEPVRPDGRLVYAVCSLFDAEGKDRVAAFLAENPSFRRVSIAEALGAPLAGRLGCDAELFLTPYRHGCDGMYACVMERVS